jgi:hypothetical protein
MPFSGGTLACNAGCTFDTSMCMPDTCLDDGIDGTDVCDGADLGGQDCVTQGFDGGALACTANCSAFDTSACYECGDGMITAPELCDGADLAGQTCAGVGFDGGTLGCAADCNGYDTSGCYECGDGVINPGETCDGADLGGQDCVSQGFAGGGTLGCALDCSAYDTSMCVAGGCEDEDIGTDTGPAVTSGSIVGADDDIAEPCGAGGGVEHLVLFTAPFGGDYTIDTFGSGYDTVLAAFTSCDPLSDITCNDDTGGLQSQIVVNLMAGQSILLSVAGFGGTTGDFVLNITAPPPPPAPACTEEDLLTNVGAAVASGTTVGEDEDLAQSCGAGGAVDRVLRFIAPATATFQFDTFGSNYDTVLALYSDCDALTELGCNDDTGGLQSQVNLPMTAGDQVLVDVSGFGGATGDWILNITQL